MVKVDQHGEKPRMFIRKTVSERLDTHGYCWWMWTLHPSMPKAQARTNVYFSSHKSPSALHPHAPNNPETFQADHAEQLEGEVGVCPAALPHGSLCHENAGNALCICHLVFISCAHSVLFMFLWLTYGLFTCCQPSCPIKATVLWMSTKPMWSLLDWMEWCIN